MKDANKRRRFSSLFLNLAAVSKKSTPAKFTYIWHFERNTINAKKFEKTQIHWRFPAAVTFVDAKHPQYNGKEPRYGEHITPVPWPIRVWNVLYNTDPAPTAHRPPPPPPPPHPFLSYNIVLRCIDPPRIHCNHFNGQQTQKCLQPLLQRTSKKWTLNILKDPVFLLQATRTTIPNNMEHKP